MLKNSPQSLGKAMLPLLLTLAVFSGCTKSYDPGNLFSDRSDLLTGKPSAVNWVLNVIQVDNVSDTSAKGTMKAYRNDGTFTDDLGFTGYWSINSRDSLIESTRPSVDPAAPYVTNRFHIDRLDKGRLQLTITNNNIKTSLIYDSNK